MVLLICNALGTFPQCVLYAFFICRTIRFKDPDRFMAVMSLTLFALYMLNNYRLQGVQMEVTLLCMLASIFLPLPFSAERVKVTLTVTGLYALAILLADGVTTGLLYFLLGDRFGGVLESMPLLVASKLLFLVIMTISFIPLRQLLLRMMKRDRLGVDWGPFFLVPVSQALLLGIILFINISRTKPESTVLVLGLAMLCCLGADVTLFLAIRQIRRGQEMQHKAWLAEQQLKAQFDYYQSMEQSILQIRRLRHDMNNQLQSAYSLMAQGAALTAEEQLNALERMVRTQVGPTFCDNLMVDAVLTNKQALCARHGITLEARVLLPAQLPVEGVHLCSLFANVLDNAIQASCQCPPEERIIRLKAGLRSGTMVVECENTVAPGPRRPSDPDRGLGLGILRDIVTTYQGDLETSGEDGRFFLSLVLPIGADREF